MLPPAPLLAALTAATDTRFLHTDAGQLLPWLFLYRIDTLVTPSEVEAGESNEGRQLLPLRWRAVLTLSEAHTARLSSRAQPRDLAHRKGADSVETKGTQPRCYAKS